MISRNEYSPRCDIKNNNISWSIMENSEIGTVIGTMSCSDEDNDELNGQLSVYPQWFVGDNQDKIPFEIITTNSNTSQV